MYTRKRPTEKRPQLQSKTIVDEPYQIDESWANVPRNGHRHGFAQRPRTGRTVHAWECSLNVRFVRFRTRRSVRNETPHRVLTDFRQSTRRTDPDIYGKSRFTYGLARIPGNGMQILPRCFSSGIIVDVFVERFAYERFILAEQSMLSTSMMYSWMRFRRSWASAGNENTERQHGNRRLNRARSSRDESWFRKARTSRAQYR